MHLQGLDMIDYFGEEINLAIKEHAKSEYPKESCGLIVDDYYMPCRNVHPEPTENFRIDPKDSLRAHKTGEVKAVIHSHKIAHSWPSLEDMEMQVKSKLPWGIVVVRSNLSTEGPYFWGCLELWPKQPYVGRPFIYGVLDCYSLCWDYYKQEFDIELPIVPRKWGWWDEGENIFVDGAPGAGLIEVSLDKIQPGDMIYMTINARKPVPNHSAIYLGNNLILHHLVKRLSRTEPFVNWRTNVTHIVRHETRF